MDGNDRVILAAGMHVDGGAGNDTLYGTVEREVLSGGTGATVLYGGGGRRSVATGRLDKR